MTKFIISSLSLVLAASPVLAGQHVPTTFTRDGETYSYVVIDKNGVQRIEGKMLSTGETFSLVVNKGRVNGEYGGRSVNFKTQDAVKSDVLASR